MSDFFSIKGTYPKCCGVFPMLRVYKQWLFYSCRKCGKSSSTEYTERKAARAWHRVGLAKPHEIDKQIVWTLKNKE